ncbi:MAG: type II toxin-antitoxin system RelB/DinJ family antitoxin [Chloroflexi bacterium]|nr:type II toxin-antitoxin system RelB/DinJ family antitoxin [Chloroflexota bacterium]
MSNVTIRARISPELKREAEAVFEVIGMTTAGAIRVFLKQAGNSGGLPFPPVARKPNAETLAAMMELEDGGGQTFQTTDELFADLNAFVETRMNADKRKYPCFPRSSASYARRPFNPYFYRRK